MLRHLLTAAGDITVSDVELAAASQAMILGFNLEQDEVSYRLEKASDWLVNQLAGWLID